MNNIDIVRKNLNLQDTLETDFKIRTGIKSSSDTIRCDCVCVNLNDDRWIEEMLFKYNANIYFYATSDFDISKYQRKYVGFNCIKFMKSNEKDFSLHSLSLFLRHHELEYVDVLYIGLPDVQDEVLAGLKDLVSYKYLQLNTEEGKQYKLDGHNCVYQLPTVNSLWERPMDKIHIRDGNFYSEQYPERPNKYFEWIWDRQPIDSDITVFSDNHIRDVEKSRSKVKVAWLIEPPVINSFIYDYAAKNSHLFDLIFTFDERLLKLGSKFKFFPYGTTWIHDPGKKVYDKTKLVSAVFSSKNYTQGHNLRHRIFSEYRNVVNFYGAINDKRIDQKIEGHKDYAFSVVVENWNGNDYFSEKLMDCLMTGTIPIYWGFPNYGKFFNSDGFLYFTNMQELDSIMSNLSMDLYQSKIEAVKDNFERAFKYIDLEEHLWKNGLKDLVNG